MDLSFLNTLAEKANQLGDFLFGTYAGIAILIGGFLLLTLLIAVILEFRTRRIYKDHADATEDEAADA